MELHPLITMSHGRSSGHQHVPPPPPPPQGADGLPPTALGYHSGGGLQSAPSGPRLTRGGSSSTRVSGDGGGAAPHASSPTPGMAALGLAGREPSFRRTGGGNWAPSGQQLGAGGGYGRGSSEDIGNISSYVPSPAGSSPTGRGPVGPQQAPAAALAGALLDRMVGARQPGAGGGKEGTTHPHPPAALQPQSLHHPTHHPAHHPAHVHAHHLAAAHHFDRWGGSAGGVGRGAGEEGGGWRGPASGVPGGAGSVGQSRSMGVLPTAAGGSPDGSSPDSVTRPARAADVMVHQASLPTKLPGA